MTLVVPEPTPQQARCGVWLVYFMLLGALGMIFDPFLPLPDGRMGHDYSLIFPAWLDGHLWFAHNGLAVPWFTPSFCAGQPFFGDPLSGFYSVPQLLDIALGPIATVRLTLYMSATLMFWGGYVLMRKGFMTGRLAGVLAGGLLLLNGFLPYRIIIGHIGFHGVALLPWMALLLLLPLHGRLHQAGAAVLAGLMLAYGVESGMSTTLPASALAVLTTGLLHVLLGGSWRQLLGRGVIAGLTGLALSASKLVASLSFLSYFPRNDYLLPGAPTLYETLAMLAGALFLGSQDAYELGKTFMIRTEVTQSPNEWAFGFGLGSAALLLVLLWDRIHRLALSARTARPVPAVKRPDWQTGFVWGALLICMAIPVALNYHQPEWNAFLKTVPILKSASTMLRWLLAYLVIFAIGLGVLLEQAGRVRWKAPAVAACLLACLAQLALDGREFYAWQNYDPQGIVESEARLRAGTLPIAITELATRADMPDRAARLNLSANNLLAAGKSALRCYNPIFGYGLENFNARNLVAGPVLVAHNGLLNMKNPACYVYPKENNCRPGDLFRVDQLEEARKFVNYQPFAFRFSPAQERANLLSLAAMLAVTVFLATWLAASCWQAWRQHQRRSHRTSSTPWR